MSDPVNVRDYEKAAPTALDAAIFDYFAGGAGDEITLAENEAAFRRAFLRPRILVDVPQCLTATSALEVELAWPVMIAPFAYLCVAHAEGEFAVARAARETGTLCCVSSLATTAPEEIAAELGSAPWWFQPYPYRDRARTAEIVARARDSGCHALIVTVDAPRLSRRERELPNAFSLPQLELPCAPIRRDLSGLPQLTSTLFSTSASTETRLRSSPCPALPRNRTDRARACARARQSSKHKRQSQEGRRG